MILNGLFLILIFDLEMLLKVIVFVLFRDIVLMKINEVV